MKKYIENVITTLLGCVIISFVILLDNLYGLNILGQVFNKLYTNSLDIGFRYVTGNNYDIMSCMDICMYMAIITFICLICFVIVDYILFFIKSFIKHLFKCLVIISLGASLAFATPANAQRTISIKYLNEQVQLHKQEAIEKFNLPITSKSITIYVSNGKLFAHCEGLHGDYEFRINDVDLIEFLKEIDKDVH